jgi:hypothetical protein
MLTPWPANHVCARRQNPAALSSVFGRQDLGIGEPRVVHRGVQQDVAEPGAAMGVGAVSGCGGAVELALVASAAAVGVVAGFLGIRRGSGRRVFVAADRFGGGPAEASRWAARDRGAGRGRQPETPADPGRAQRFGSDAAVRPRRSIDARVRFELCCGRIDRSFIPAAPSLPVAIGRPFPVVSATWRLTSGETRRHPGDVGVGRPPSGAAWATPQAARVRRAPRMARWMRSTW